jgi:hypothetical protein
MKKLNYILTLLLATTLIWSCSDDNKVMINDTVTAPVLKAPATTSVVLTKANAALTAVTLEWTAPDYGYQAPAMYSLLIAKKGKFKDSVLVATSYQPKISVTVADLNAKLLAMGAIPDLVNEMEMKIVSSIPNTKIADKKSNVIALQITPFEEIIIYPHLNMPGNYQGWKGEGTDLSRIYSAKSDGSYEGFINMIDGGNAANAIQFKFTKVNWGDGEYSYDGAGKLKAGGGDNIALTSGGYYKVAANLNNLTYSVTPITRVGIIGDALNPEKWDSDRAMTYDATLNVWTLTLDLIGGKEMKFRMNGGWDLNYGDTGADLKLEPGGDNIKVAESGNYTVTLDLSKAIYKYKVKKN